MHSTAELHPAAAAGENFPVALRVLPAATRTDLLAVYDVVRTIDELGDSAEGDRTALLQEFSADLHRVWTARPGHPALVGLVPTARRRRLPEQPFQDLVAANLMDQRVGTYETWDDLLGYCALSAAPVGRLVLALFGESTPSRVERSDRVCTALQLLEHWQDVGEDRRAGRVYLPQEDLRAWGVLESDLDRLAATPALRALVLHETDRAAQLLSAGASLTRELHGWARLAVTGYVAGGWATVDALRRSGGDVLSATPRPQRRDAVRHGLRHLLRRAA
ncbi:squalene synthase HpnC [Motilibacter peucedani]|uniref:Squalene synthase HpnC n=1 Tax=Motilibacter peucedani TaxID=598650 RepID=A0A420XK35_9ACTN|nr:squalene synthase HpnC [Motilibacter peucedani]RKS67986.1 squalene synthase HpnC [Motilibacter peucedani]